MTLVSIDVPAARGAATAITDLATRAESQSDAVRDAASRADESVPQLSPVFGFVSDLRERAEGLSARVDLAIVVNGGDEGALSGGPVTFEVPTDTTDAVKVELGTQIANSAQTLDGSESDRELIEDLNARMARWLDDEAVMSALSGELGPEGTLNVIAAVGQSGYGDPETTLPFARSIRAGLETASSSWDDDEARDWGRLLAEAAVRPGFDSGSAYEGTDQGLALSFLADLGDHDADLLTGIADGIDDAERSGDLPQGFWNQRSNIAMSALWHAFP
ncbi:MAG: hypothetical protein F2825_05010, partial [Actinobacteria bacterium]|nr:hypothetical protein [Actinomycetota bacterium]